MVRQFYDGMLARGDYSEQIPVTTGDKQGCVLPALTLFSMMFSAMLTRQMLFNTVMMVFQLDKNVASQIKGADRRARLASLCQ